MANDRPKAPETAAAPTNTSLEALRREIDALDTQLVELLAQRMQIVGKVAATKRQSRTRIRDFVREREIFDRRGAHAASLGLPRAEIESIFRLILRASREYQAALRTEVPPQFEPKRIVVVGGRGKLGRRLVQLFEELGHEVQAVDQETELSIAKAAQSADVVIVSVPIEVTEKVVREVGPHVRPEALLMDVTSIKQGPMAAMLASTRASVVGTHPMFGPDVHSVQGQRVVLCPGRGDEWLEWVRTMLSARGCILTECSADEHDRAMAIVQVLIHYRTQVFGRALSLMGTPIDQSLRFTSPAYLLELYIAARHFAQDARLYGPIEMLNPETPRVLTAFAQATREVAEIIEQHDQQGFDRLFQEVSKFFGPFTTEALEQSSYLIDRLVERS